MDTIQNGVQLLTQSQNFLQDHKFYLPFQNEVLSAISLNKPFSKLSSFIQGVAVGYLGIPVYQEISVNMLIDNPIRANAVYEQYHKSHLVVTKADSLEEKILNFCQVRFIVDVIVLKLLMASEKWDHILSFCQQNGNSLLVFGTIVNDKYVHHLDIPRIDVFRFAPQFLVGTDAPKEIEIGEQFLKGSD